MVFLSSVLGAFATHLLVLHREIDFHVLHLLGLYLVVFAALAYNLTPLSALVCAAYYNATLTASILTHRLLLHRLRRFPGPLGAKVSKIWLMLQTWKKPQMHLLTDKLHKEYGDFVRVGPRELSISHPAAIHAIYGVNLQKSLYYGYSGSGNEASLFLLRDGQLHARRRQAWDRALNGTSLGSYVPKLRVGVEQLVTELKARAGESVDISEWAKFFAFDMIGSVGLGKSYGCMESGKLHEALPALEGGNWFFAVPGLVPWLMKCLFSIPGAGGAMVSFYKWCTHEMELRIQEMKESGSERCNDVASHLLSDPRCGLGKIPYSATLDDCRLIIIAGSDTTGAALGVALFFLTLHPHIFETLYSYHKSKDNAYLDAVINETLRLFPPVGSTTGLTRVTPKQGINIDGTHIPGDVFVSIPPYTLFRDPRYWTRPNEFWPERWLENSELGRGLYVPFSTGAYQCPGKQFAMAQLRMAIGGIVDAFEKLEFVDPKDAQERFEADMLDYFVKHPPACRVRFTPRKTE
ncbi:cytochrome P450 [Trichophaea hybrida]|nr:cytochrome P450 [Trichophaea hybrida]